MKLLKCRYLIGNLITAAVMLVMAAGCQDTVEPEVYSEMTPSTTLSTEEGVVGVLRSGYQHSLIESEARIWGSMEFQTDVAWETGGGANQWAVPFIHLTYDPSTPNLWRLWERKYKAIRDANIILANLENIEAPDEKIALFESEARFIRAINYIYLRRWFGPVPLRTSTEDSLALSRATGEEIRTFIEEELRNAIPNLPEPGNEPVYGRAHKGAARGFLTKFFLNTKQWQKAADMAEVIIDAGNFSLFPDYVDMFHIRNERNNEYIWVHPKKVGTKTNNNLNAAFPPEYKEHPTLGLEYKSSMRNWARQDRLMDEFANSFNPDDERGKLIIDKYINMDGDTVSLTEKPDNQRCLKYYDPDAVGGHGTDLPEIRYADILLSRAEALNEINGPNQESIDLINQVRDRAGLDDLSLSEFNSKKELRSHILKERGWEFYWEMKRRQDLIRMGKFVETARSLGADRGNPDAQEYKRLLPIPQQAMDSNPKLKQNPGY